MYVRKVEGMGLTYVCSSRGVTANGRTKTDLTQLRNIRYSVSSMLSKRKSKDADDLSSNDWWPGNYFHVVMHL